jgi:hypothetical protein
VARWEIRIVGKGEEKHQKLKRQQFRHIGAFERLTVFNHAAPRSSAPKTRKRKGEEMSRHSFA